MERRKRRTCCCCFSITAGVFAIGLITGFNTFTALFSLKSEYGWVELLFRAAMMPFFMSCCFYKKEN